MKKNRKSYPIRVLSYSLKQKEAKEIRQLLKIPGKHNVSNALGVLAVSRELNIPDKTYYKAIADYKGAWRRFEIKEICLNNKPGRNKERITLVSDYAHHPSEIKATISGARDKFKKRRIWVIFQPHQYQRTFHLFDDFVRAFDEANEVILTEIYGVAGRERTKISSHVSGATLALAVKKRGKSVSFVKDYKKIPDFLKPRLKDKDVVLVMGAGDIYKIVAEF